VSDNLYWWTGFILCGVGGGGVALWLTFWIWLKAIDAMIDLFKVKRELIAFVFSRVRARREARAATDPK